MNILKEECCICLEKNLAQTGRSGALNCNRMTCCGCCFCNSCLDQFEKQEKETGVPWDCPLCPAPHVRNDKEDFDRAMRKAKEGKGWAQEWIGLEYYRGSDVVPQSFTKAFEFLSLAAAQEVANAQNHLGIMYSVGRGVEQSYEKGFQFFKQAADQGLPLALIGLGGCYQNGLGVDKSLEKAFGMYLLGAEGGCTPAQFYLGQCYFNGDGVKVDYEKAIHFFTLGAEKGDKKSQIKLAKCYGNGEGVKQSFVKSIYWFKQCLKDNPNKEQCANAQKNLDVLLLHSSLSCAECGNSEGKFTLKCSRCLSVYYCNSVCQAKHWKEGGHKAECNIYKKA